MIASFRSLTVCSASSILGEHRFGIGTRLLTWKRPLVLLLALLSLTGLLRPVAAQDFVRQPIGAKLGISSDGYHYIRFDNSSKFRVGMTVSYRKKYADGKRAQLSVTAILEPGESNKMAHKCAMRPPQEEISDVVVLEMKMMTK